MKPWRAGPVCLLAICLLGAWAAAPAEQPPAPWAGAAYEPVAQLHGAPGAVAVSGSRVFLVQGTTVTEWDGANPTRLRPLGRGPILRGPLEELALAGDLLVGHLRRDSAAPRIEFLDISAAAAPRWVGGLSVDGLSAAAVLDGTLLHLAVGRQLRRVEVADPAAPRQNGTLELPAEMEPRVLAATGERLYLAAERGMGVVESAAEAMTLTGQYRLPVTERNAGVAAVGVLADGDRAVLVQGRGNPLVTVTPVPPTRRRPPPEITQTGTVTLEPVRTPRPTQEPTEVPLLRVMDVAQEAAPRPLGELRGGIQGVWNAQRGVMDRVVNRAYLVGSRTFRVIDIGYPGQPRQLAQRGTDSDSAPALLGERVLLSEPLRLRNLDLRTPSAPREDGSLELPPWRVLDLQRVAPGLVAVALTGFGIRILDVQDPTAPRDAAVLPLPRLRAMQVLVDVGPPLLLALDGTELVIVNPLDAVTPREIGRLRLENVAANTSFGRGRIVVTGGAALVAMELAGLLLVDLADPTRPLLVGRYAGCDAEEVVALPAGFVAVRCANTSQVHVLDVHAPRQPRRVGLVFAGAWPMLAAGDFVYLLASPLLVLDARDPRRPTLLDPGVGDVGRDGEVAGNRLYTVGPELRSFDIGDARQPRLLATVVVPSRIETYAGEQTVAVDGERLLVGDTVGTGLTVLLRRAPSPEAASATPTLRATSSPSASPSSSPTAVNTIPSTAPAPRGQPVLLPWAQGR